MTPAADRFDAIWALHGRQQASEALARCGGSVLFVMPPGGVIYAGPTFYLEILRELRRGSPGREIELLIDCGDDAAIAVEAIRLGARDVFFAGHANAANSLRSIAEQADVRLWQTLPCVIEPSAP